MSDLASAWRNLALKIREDAARTDFDERYRLETKAAQLEACALELETKGPQLFDGVALDKPDDTAVTRFELIDHRQGTPTLGRAYVTYGDMSVTVSPQDGKRTIKIFLDGTYSKEPPWWGGVRRG